MFKLYATGQYSLPSLSEEMARRGLKTKNGKCLVPEKIKRILQNKFYIGKMVMWGEEVKGKHKPIIDESLFKQVQNILAERKIAQEKWQRREFLLRGLLYCQNCKRRLTAEVHPRGEYYKCPYNVNNKKCSEPYIPTKKIENQIEDLYDLMEPSPKLLKLLEAEIEEVQRNFQAKSKKEIANLKKRIAENEAKMDALVDNLASRVITPDVYKKYSQKYRRETKDAKDRLAVLEKDYSSNFDFIDKCMILASTLSRLHKKFSFRQRKKLAKAIFKRIWVKNREIRKIQLNPPFDFLLKNQTRKIHSIFPNLKFEHYPIKSTKQEMFEHLVNSIESPVYHLVQSLIKT
jgi:hypothetical protein